jgi:hypothetical protein
MGITQNGWGANKSANMPGGSGLHGSVRWLAVFVLTTDGTASPPRLVVRTGPAEIEASALEVRGSRGRQRLLSFMAEKLDSKIMWRYFAEHD